MSKEKNQKRITRHKKVRAKVKGTKKCPRLNVFRSNRGMYVQLIDDEKGVTIISAHSKEITSSKPEAKGGKKAAKKEVSSALGKLIAKKALSKKITKVVFDRSGYKYHGRVKALAEGAREGGLKF